MLVVNLAFGVMTRAAPQLNVFAVGFPITLLMGFTVILLTLPGVLGEVGAVLDHLVGFALGVFAEGP
jgi:flagellar biosynthetic protein FliR